MAARHPSGGPKPGPRPSDDRAPKPARPGPKPARPGPKPARPGPKPNDERGPRPSDRAPKPTRPGANAGRDDRGRRPGDDRSAKPAPPGQRRSLANLGGEVTHTGDATLAPLMRKALELPADFDERALTHGFHAWPARLHPHTARTLIAAAPAGAIADPFMGGGTVPLEARLAQRLAVGNDLNPVGLEVAWVRTLRLDKPALTELRDATRLALRLAEDLANERRPPAAWRDKVAYALDPQAQQEVWALAAVLDDNLRTTARPVWRILRAALSSILVKVSRLVSDSVAKVDRSRTTWTPRGRVLHWFKRRVGELTDQLSDVAQALPEASPDPLLTLGDARQAPPLPPVGAVISSPPYPGIYDYVEHHRLRLLALNLPVAPMIDQEIGSRRESERAGLDVGLARYVDDLERVLSAWSATLVPGGFVAFIIGDGQVGAKVTPVVPLLERAAAPAGLKIRAVASQSRPVFAGGKTPVHKAEHLVWLERP